MTAKLDIRNPIHTGTSGRTGTGADKEPTGNTSFSLSKLSDLTWSDLGDWLLDRPLKILFILVVAYLARWLLHRGINTLIRTIQWRRSTGDTGSIGVVDPMPTAQLPVMRRGARKAARAVKQAGLVNTDRQGQRLDTLGSLLRSIVSVLVWVTAALMIGTELGINMAPIIASAGVGGVAIAFGAQSIVKDFISGLFMMFEDQYGVGDLVDTGEAIGTVEEVTLRVTRLRDATGVVWYVRNGQITRIANRTQGFQTGAVDIPVSIEEDPGRVISILKRVVADVYIDPRWRKSLLEEPTVAGVESLEGGTMTIRIFAKCVADQQWGVMREIREHSKKALSARGIAGPLLMPSNLPWAPHAAKPKEGTDNNTPPKS
ncbi:mechanosensitive ion channel family protein [Dermatophilus congolensis]|nr:mechanosensitive ion channel family protein [Dermatophilus congolensis]MBO3132220.1 mechanosensitive ion channel family protein [Dermatophilus congolensis]MBO3133621.1 mechanosensitive ion channel family protein [Dermatophilus congolensis]MBO3135854.1 mechanosensitive ion channel family protein [Dermatophilus congolensis]MBO3138094.1 mechanosensitive ion channel family protein [Dermatophilus congolensis]